VSNGLQNHEDLFVTLAAAAGQTDLKDKLLKGDKMNGSTYKVHLDGYNNLDHWMGKSEKSARREYFYYDETDLMAIRVDNWKMHIGVKPEGSCWNEKYYPNVPYLFNPRMDPMEKMDPESKEWGTSGGSSSPQSCGRQRRQVRSSPHISSRFRNSRRRRVPIRSA
jgi:arylsulfatase